MTTDQTTLREDLIAKIVVESLTQVPCDEDSHLPSWAYFAARTILTEFPEIGQQPLPTLQARDRVLLGSVTISDRDAEHYDKVVVEMTTFADQTVYRYVGLTCAREDEPEPQVEWDKCKGEPMTTTSGYVSIATETVGRLIGIVRDYAEHTEDEHGYSFPVGIAKQIAEELQVALDGGDWWNGDRP